MARKKPARRAERDTDETLKNDGPAEEATALAIYVRAFVTPAHPDVVPTPAGSPPAALAASPQRTPIAPTLESGPSAPAPIQPAELYTTFCLACHDKDGRGGLVKAAMPKIPDLTDTTWQQSIADDAIVRSILDGKGQFMRPFNDKLSAAEAQALAGYVRHFPTLAPATVAAVPKPTPPTDTTPPASKPSPQTVAQPVPGETVTATQIIGLAPPQASPIPLTCPAG